MTVSQSFKPHLEDARIHTEIHKTLHYCRVHRSQVELSAGATPLSAVIWED